MTNNKVAIIPYERYQSLIRANQTTPEVQLGLGIEKTSKGKVDTAGVKIKQPPPGIPAIEEAETLESDSELEDLNVGENAKPQVALRDREKQGNNWRSKWIGL